MTGPGRGEVTSPLRLKTIEDQRLCLGAGLRSHQLGQYLRVGDRFGFAVGEWA